MDGFIDWTLDETAELFAHVNIIAETNQPTRLSPAISDEVFLKRLQESLGNGRPLDQIMDKLREHLQGSFRNISIRGSRCMKLDDDMIQAVEAKLVAIRLSTPRKLRSTLGKRSRPDGGSVTPTRSSPATPVAPAARQLATSRAVSADKPATNKRSQRSQSTLTSEIPDTSSADIEDELECSQSLETRRGKRPGNYRNKIPIPGSRAPSDSVIPVNGHKRLHMLDYSILDPILNTREEDVQDCSHETLQDILDENMDLRRMLDETTKENEKLAQVARLHRSTLKIQSGELGSQAADPLKGLYAELAELKRQINDRKEFLDPFLKIENEHQKSVHKQMNQIERYWHTLRRDLESFLEKKEFRYPQQDGLKEVSTTDLNELWRRVSGDVQESVLLPHLRSQMRVGDVVQAIVGTAVCEWVFEAELRCTAMLKTPILNRVEYFLSTMQGGKEAFQSAYFAANRSFLDSEGFKAVYIPKTATKLADRLANALGPFTSSKGRRRHMNSIKKDLETIFQHALKVKIQVIVGNHMFGTIWPSRGSAYVESLMETQSIKGVPGRDEMGDYAVLKVELPLVPGLRVYSSEISAVDYRGFVKDDETAFGKSDVFCKAVVT